jgi:hypothetical protein
MEVERDSGFVQTPVKEGKVIKHLIWTIPKPKFSPLDKNKMKDRIKHSHLPVRVVISRS